MKNNENIMRKEIKKRNREIILELSLYINKELYNENEITYKQFKITEDSILKEMKNKCRNNF